MTVFADAYPLSIGVTGHRSLDAATSARLEQAVTRVLEELRAKAPYTPLLMLSALAEGADRLVARLAIDRFDASLIAVLPMAVEEYAKDFETSDSQTEFKGLLGRAVQVVVTVPPGLDPGDHAQRRAAYARAGEWVALHSQVLIALWDGDTARGTGGTAEVVQAKLTGRYPHLDGHDLLASEDGGAVAHINTPRTGSSEPPRDASCIASTRWLYPGAMTGGAQEREAHFRAVLSAIDRLNRLSTAR